MLLRVAAIGQRMPGWVTAAWHEYARRFPGNIRLELAELPLERRGNNPDIERLRKREGEALVTTAVAEALHDEQRAGEIEPLAAVGRVDDHALDATLAPSCHRRASASSQDQPGRWKPNIRADQTTIRTGMETHQPSALSRS